MGIVVAGESEGPMPSELDGVERFEQLFKQHSQLVYRVCLAKLGDMCDAEDAVQEVFLRAVRHEGSMTDDPRPWLVQTAKTVCVDEYRRRRRRADALSNRSWREGTRATQDPERRVVARAVLDEVLSCLTPAERNVVVERWLHDQSHLEAGRSLGIAASTTRALLTRARRRMRAFAEAQDLVGSLVVGWLFGAGAKFRHLLSRLTNPVLMEALGPVGVAMVFAVAVTAAAAVPTTRQGDPVSIEVKPVALIVPASTGRAEQAMPDPAVGPVVPPEAPMAPHMAPRPEPDPRDTGGQGGSGGHVGDFIQPPPPARLPGQRGYYRCVSDGHGYFCPDESGIAEKAKNTVPAAITGIPTPVGNPVPGVVGVVNCLDACYLE